MSDGEPDGERPPDILGSDGTSEPTGLPNVLPDASRTARRRRAPWVIGIAVVATTGFAGGAIALSSTLSGGGTQPEEVLPAGAAVFADVDFDPSAAQKVNALRFLRSLPQVSGTVGDSGTLKDSVLRAVLSDSPLSADQVSAWIGDRVGFALVPGAGPSATPEPVVALQVSDLAKATQELPKLLSGGGGFAVEQDYVIVASSTEVAQQVARDAQASPLSQDAAFTSAVSDLGDGVATVYVDGAEVASWAAATGTPAAGLLGLPDGQVAAVLRFQPDALELVGGATVGETYGSTERLVADLPGSTLAALGMVVTPKRAAEVVDQLSAAAQMTLPGRWSAQLRRYGFSLRADLRTLLGSDLVVAVDGISAGSPGPQVAYRSLTDPAAARDLVRRMDPLLQQVTGGLGVVVRPTSDGVVAASSSSWADRVAAGSGDLGQTATFGKAVPEADGAVAIGFVDLQALQQLWPQEQSPLRGLAGFGFSVHVAGDQASFLARLTLG